MAALLLVWLICVVLGEGLVIVALPAETAPPVGLAKLDTLDNIIPVATLPSTNTVLVRLFIKCMYFAFLVAMFT